MDKEKANQIRRIKRGCEHCIDLGVQEGVNYCAIAMVLLGMQNAKTR